MISNPVIMLDWTALSSHVTGTIRYNGFLGIHSSMKIISRRELIVTDIIITAYGRCIEIAELSTDAGSRWCWSASIVLVSSVSAFRRRKEDDPAVAGSSINIGIGFLVPPPEGVERLSPHSQAIRMFWFSSSERPFTWCLYIYKPVYACATAAHFFLWRLTQFLRASPGGVCSNQQLHPRYERDP